MDVEARRAYRVNLDELRAWISAHFWKSAQVMSWAERTFYRRKQHQQTSSGTGSGTLPIITLADGTIDTSFITSTAVAEYIADTAGAMVTGNTETGIAVTYQDSDNTLDFVVDTEFISDTVGAMVTGNTESGIAVTYQDADNTLDFTVAAATANIDNDAVTFAKMQNIATDSLIGRDTAATGDPENITLNATLSMTGSGALQRAALTGDVTASAGSNATTIANNAVSNAKAADMAQSTIKGRATAAGTGDPTDLTPAQVATLLSGSLNPTHIAPPSDGDGVFPGPGTYAFATQIIATGGILLTGGIDGLLSLNSASATIASGVITATASLMIIDTEAAAATDDLVTINGGSLGDILVLMTTASTRDVVIKDGTGNISCPADRTLSHVDDMWVGMFRSSRWNEISYADNA